MALFLEVHEVGGSSLRQIAAAHAADLAALRARGVRYLRHWFSESSGRVVCLVEAPDAETLQGAQGDPSRMVVRELTGVLGSVAPEDERR